MTLPKVLIADSISQHGIDELSRDNGVDVSIQTKLSPAKLIEIIPEFAALIVRS
ncbi:MAG: phosphoglycerate dehydrogenase, partial [Verrucomicrobia bacterium]